MQLHLPNCLSPLQSVMFTLNSNKIFHCWNSSGSFLLPNFICSFQNNGIPSEPWESLLSTQVWGQTCLAEMAKRERERRKQFLNWYFCLLLFYNSFRDVWVQPNPLISPPFHRILYYLSKLGYFEISPLLSQLSCKACHSKQHSNK